MTFCTESLTDFNVDNTNKLTGQSIFTDSEIQNMCEKSDLYVQGKEEEDVISNYCLSLPKENVEVPSMRTDKRTACLIVLNNTIEQYSIPTP